MGRQAKDNSTSIEVLFTDFRISLAFHTIRAGIRYLHQVLAASKQLRGDLAKMKELQQPSQSPPQVPALPQTQSRAEPKEVDGRTQILVNISNIEAWLPEDVAFLVSLLKS